MGKFVIMRVVKSLCLRDFVDIYVDKYMGVAVNPFTCAMGSVDNLSPLCG